ncbi:hypothetical protein H6P81_017330 [Aristolochia fimbriata]|uniref:SDR family NAD(P)-dependent oxidoreductase n=1 Tax=Aristolochia fimbriata TaxID=158543 RepID=A0AAV7E0Q7_ARIFI|nr:hypothetical protein H6P81_017330 [Aristolochia fimbriata]
MVRHRSAKVPIEGRHVFFTGGSSGIRLAASQGARISILARNLKKLEKAHSSIRRSTGVDVAVYSADVRDFEAVARALDEARPVDGLICNQGGFAERELDSQEIKEVGFMIDVNLVGTFHDGRPAYIALMSSQVGQRTRAGQNSPNY